MFKRPHHQKIAQVLSQMDVEFLRETKCYFGGGTAISLLLGEYRESLDIDFMCSDQGGYRKLRESVFDRGIDEIFCKRIETLREVRADRDGIRAVLAVEGVPIKFEIVREARIHLEGASFRDIPVLCLSKNDLFSEKLLANVDRYGDRAVMGRDLIDLLMMESRWGDVPVEALAKAEGAYGAAVLEALSGAKSFMASNPAYLQECLREMGIEATVGEDIRRRLETDLGWSLGRPS